MRLHSWVTFWVIDPFMARQRTGEATAEATRAPTAAASHGFARKLKPVMTTQRQARNSRALATAMMALPRTARLRVNSLY